MENVIFWKQHNYRDMQVWVFKTTSQPFPCFNFLPVFRDSKFFKESWVDI